MTILTYGATLGADFGNNRWAVDAARCSPVTVDVAAAIAHVVTLDGLVVDAKAAVAAAKTSALACQTANVAVTPVENAIALLEADGASPTQGHVNSLRTVWNTLSTNCTAHNIAANNSATAATDADTSVKLVNTTDISGHLSAMTAETSADVIVSINDATVTRQAAVRAALASIWNRIEGGGLAP